MPDPLPPPPEGGAPQSEIDRLWARVASLAPVEPMPAPTAAAQEVAWETVALLKRQRRREAEQWTELLEAKERALAAAAERQARLEGEVRALRHKAQSAEENLLGEGLELQSKMGAALFAL